ncbi:MAG TPA: peptidylprolyl isomerase [Myxococcota bacterium]|nr:peptidylprolyl isomerase [Myxococcota bacterium]
MRRALARSACLRFFVLGAVLLVLERSFPSGARAEGGAWPPSACVGDEGPCSDDALLFDAALAQGLERSDPVVRRRLADDLRFLGVEQEASDEALVVRALALGLDRSDPVVRRRLVNRMRLRAVADADATDVDEADLARRLGVQSAALATPTRVRIEQVFLDRARRGARTEADARAVLFRLRAGASAEALGDAFLEPTRVGPASERALARHFGETFARAVLALPEGGWSEPIPSAAGLHLVRVLEREPARPAKLAEVRNQLADLERAGREQAALGASVASLRVGRGAAGATEPQP